MTNGLALDRQEFNALLTLLSARSVYGVASLSVQPQNAAGGLKKLTARGLLQGAAADQLLRLMSVLVSPRFVVVAEATTGATALHYLDDSTCVSLEGGLAGFRLGLVPDLGLLARRLLRAVGFDPTLTSTPFPSFTVSEAVPTLGGAPEALRNELAQALGDASSKIGGQVLVLRGSGERGRRAKLVGRSGGQGFLLHRPVASQPQLLVEPLSATRVEAVLGTFITWLSK